MNPAGDWPAAELIATPRLVLEPVRAEHAEEMVAVLDDRRLHAYVGGEPLSLEALRARYRRLLAGRSADGTRGWLNWVIRERQSAAALGSVQATLSRSGRRLSAEIAWVVCTAHQGRGYATEAAGQMVEWLRRQGAEQIIAHIHPRHRASARVAERLGLTATDAISDGETRWVSGRRAGERACHQA